MILASLSLASLDAAAPPIGFSSYFGGSETEIINDIAVDLDGNVYVVGTTGGAADFPQVNAHQTTDPEDPDYREFEAGQTNCFVASFAPNGALRFSTYLGGSLSEEGLAIALDESANVYVTGVTQSYRYAKAPFPTTEGAFKTEFNAFECAFVASYTSGGALRYSTVYEAPGGESSRAGAIHANADGSATVMLRLTSQWRLVTFSPGGAAVTQTIPIGNGSYSDMARDRDGNFHVVGLGLTLGSTANSFAPGMSAGPLHAGYQFRSPDGAIVYAAHWAADSARAVAVDDDGRAVVVGGVEPTTLTPSHISTAYPFYGFPLKNAFQPTYGGGDSDAYALVIDPGETGDASLVASSFLGGAANDAARAVATDALGRIFVAGETLSANFPVVDGFPQFAPAPPKANGFLAQLNDSASGVIFSSLIGGNEADQAQAVAVELFGDFIAVGGRTESDDLHEVNGLQPAKGAADAFLLFSDVAIVLESLIVNSANDFDDGSCDSAHCSLREAIKAANQRTDRPTITFDVPGEETPIIQPSSVLPGITAPMVIDATTQEGGWVVLDGAAHPLGQAGILIANTDEVELRGLVVQNFDGDGIKVTGGQGHRLSSLRVGTTRDGMAAAKNSGAGIRLIDATDSILGGPNVGDALVVSGNGGDGIVIEGGGGHAIDDIVVGLDMLGRDAVPNEGFGIIFKNTSDNVLGAADLGPKRNVVSGNTLGGILFTGLSSEANAVYRTHVGLDQDGAAPRPNGDSEDSAGIRVEGAWSTQIGDAGKGNVISANSGDGIQIESAVGVSIRGNRIGTDAQGESLGETQQAYGVAVWKSSGVVIGGETDVPGSGAGNVISGHSKDGISIHSNGADEVRVLGNIIGLNAAGDEPLPNGGGVIFTESSAVIGGASAGARNLISGNEVFGIRGSWQDSPRPVRIEGNWIGVGPLGAEAFGNGENGILLEGAIGDLRIGGSAETPGKAPGNVIAGNANGGLLILPNEFASGPMLVAGNIVGLSADGQTSPAPQAYGIRTADTNGLEFAIRGNVVSGNAGVGILIGPSDVDDESELELALEGNRIGPALGDAVIGNGGAGIEIGAGSGARLLMGLDNVVTGNKGGGIVADENGGAALFRQSIYGNDGPELDLSGAPPKILGVWRQPAFPGFPAPEDSLMVACEPGFSHLSSKTIEIFHSEACDPDGSGQGQTWLAASSVDFFQPLVTAFLREAPATGFLSARELRSPGVGSGFMPGLLNRPSFLESSSFSQCADPRGFLPDSDGDGIPDLIESSGDANEDGVPDGEQRAVGSFRLPGDEGIFGAAILTAGQALESMGYSDLRGYEPPPIQGALPSGYLGFRVESFGATPNSTGPRPAAGGVAEFALYPPEGQRVDSVWARQPGAPEGQRWIDITDRVDFGEGQLRFALTDGEALDLDGEANAYALTLALLRHVDGIEIASWGFGEDGRLVLDALGRVGGSYALYGSEDLASWTLLQEADAPLGFMKFDLSPPDVGRYRFARLVEKTD